MIAGTLWLVLWLSAGYVLLPTAAQVVWTPIYADRANQVDMWTVQSKGCECSFDRSRTDCACCVQDSGCQCGMAAPNRCGQCGLQQYCNNMCNITVDSRTLSEKSKKSYGQIKSSETAGPTFCWYRLLPDYGQRVEIQLYRLINVGHFNSTNCESGFVQLVDGVEAIPRPERTQICGSNERFAPPVVLFADNGPSTLLFKINEQTDRSQFLAYFSFTSSNSSNGVGFQPSGGRSLQDTECDWAYQETACRELGYCRLASPGYPGLYSPNINCKYHITANSLYSTVRVTFHGFHLPDSNCQTDRVRIYQGSTPDSPVVTTLCGTRKKELLLPGPQILLEFTSGQQVYPFSYNGFMATLEFMEKEVTTETPVIKTTDSVAMMDGLWNTTARPCEITVFSNNSRSGRFDSRDMDFHHNCTVTFIGTDSHVVHISLFSYRLRGSSCQSTIEVYDGLANDGVQPLKKICGPVTRHVRDHSGRFIEKQMFISSQNIITLYFRRFLPTNSQAEMDFVDGAYLFHDEHLEGTLRPSTLCDADYHGDTSQHRGQISNSGEENLFWNLEGPLKCSHTFLPINNQSIMLKVVYLNRLAAEPHCHTECGDGGCRCVTSILPLNQLDHLRISVVGTEQTLACICGDFREEWLPVGVQTWSPVKLEYSVAHYSWTMKGFSFQTDYRFSLDHHCGHYKLTQHSGVINSGNISASDQLNFYYHQSCTWLLDSNVERQLNIHLSSNQNRPCTAWNLSIHEYTEHHAERVGAMLHTFCPREKDKHYSLPYKLNIVVVKLTAMTRTPPEFQIKWRSQVVLANTRIAGPTPTFISEASTCYSFVTLPVLLLHLLTLSFR